MRGVLGGTVALAAILLLQAPLSPPAGAQEPDPGAAAEEPTQLLNRGVLEVRFTPTDFAQFAIWVETLEGRLVSTLGLTEAVAYRGIGNRPGASQMNSGFRWPYGRREGVLPVWATRRASAPGAAQFQRVIFQDRKSEGHASRSSSDYSRDDYYCLSFDRSRAAQDALDAVSCASIFNSDKGRFITEADLADGYSEPYQDLGADVGRERELSLWSLYPPRRDVRACTEGCFDHADVDLYVEHAREVMPELDAITMATPAANAPQRLLHTLPPDFAPGDYRVCIEVNVEGDYNPAFGPEDYPTPTLPEGRWDSWAMGYGYPYRGQPSVVYCVEAELGSSAPGIFSADGPVGSAGSWALDQPDFGAMQPMEGMTDDPVGAPGSGADRLQQDADGVRLQVLVKPPVDCANDAPPGAIEGLAVSEYPERLDAHHFAELRFEAADDDRGVFGYQVRISTDPITDEASFMAAQPAKQATLEAEALELPGDVPAGEGIESGLGGLVQQTHYYVGVRAMDACAGVGPLAVAEFTTPERIFATVTPCFVATAAYGSPLAREIGVLRRLRDRYLMPHALGRSLVNMYYAAGPTLAAWIAEHPDMRSAVRSLLSPLVTAAQASQTEP
ncbi:MAG: hypothetical protein OEZ06_32495 [Myxococcales bacterium]|nr:hypothetical protein [Myxococcales bacterium]